MFYIKTKQYCGKTINIEITDENVFTRCPECRREMPVDLAEIFADGEGDLISTQVLCAACAKRSVMSRLSSEDSKLATDGITVLANVLRKAGYWRELSLPCLTSLKLRICANLSRTRCVPFQMR